MSSENENRNVFVSGLAGAHPAPGAGDLLGGVWLLLLLVPPDQRHHVLQVLHLGPPEPHAGRGSGEKRNKFSSISWTIGSR